MQIGLWLSQLLVCWSTRSKQVHVTRKQRRGNNIVIKSYLNLKTIYLSKKISFFVCFCLN